jgi:thiol-disulfide isomerase/thioredoxin
MAQFGVDQSAVLMHIYRLALNDPSAKQLQQRALANGGNDAATATVAAAAAEYLDAAQDESAQLAALDHLQQTIGSVKPVSMGLRGNAGMPMTPVNRLPEIFMHDNPPASEAVSARIVDFLNSSPNQLWRENAQQIPILEHRLQLLNKPMTIAGTLVNGSLFSTAKWKGKVILVDFWATWCPDCVAALPTISRIYSANHARGLEVLSISSDDNLPRLQSFLGANSYISWPQLLDFQLPAIDQSSPQIVTDDSSGGGPEHPRFRREAQAFALWGQPAIYLIDRKGNLRFAYVRSETNRDALIAKLLAEKP